MEKKEEFIRVGTTLYKIVDQPRIDEAEVEMAMKEKVEPITLGKRILRTETAGMTVLSILVYLLEGRERTR